MPDSVHEVRNEGMPVAGRTYEHGSLYIKFRVTFPATLSAKAVEALRAALPAGLPPVVRSAEHVPATTTPATGGLGDDDDGHGHGHGHSHGNAYDDDDEDEDEDDGRPQGVQCAQQ